MDWTTGEGYGIPIGTHCHMSSPKEVSPVSFTLHLSPFTRKQLYRHLQQAYARGALRVVKRIHVLLALAEDMSVQKVADMLGLGEQTVRAYRNRFLLKRMASLTYKRPPGRPRKLTKAQRRELTDVIKAGPQAAGYTSGCWNTPMIQDLLQNRFGVSYHPHYLATLLHNLGFSYQKARFVSDHLNEAKRLEWWQTRWPRIFHPARQTKTLWLFGDEASFAQWGSLSYTWAPKGAQPDVRTSGKRKGYKVFGLIDYFSGQFSTKPMRGALILRAMRPFCSKCWLTRAVRSSWYKTEPAIIPVPLCSIFSIPMRIA